MELLLLILSSFEKIISHCMNISIASVNFIENMEYFTKKDFLNMIYTDKKQELENYASNIREKYKLLELDNKLSRA